MNKSNERLAMSNLTDLQQLYLDAQLENTDHSLKPITIPSDDILKSFLNKWQEEQPTSDNQIAIYRMKIRMAALEKSIREGHKSVAIKKAREIELDAVQIRDNLRNNS